MGLAAPLELFWAMTLLAVVLLYLRWAKRKVFSTTTLSIWQQALSRRTLWSRWRRAVSLAAACVPIVLISLALAKPYLWPAVQTARTIVVVIDNTASMNAAIDERSRLAQAKRQAHNLIASLRTHEQMAILSADSAMHVRCGLTVDAAKLRAAVDRIQQTDGAGAMPAAIATAERLAADHRNGTVVLVSDGAFAGADALDQSDKLAWIPVGQPADNVAITRFAARPQLHSASNFDVLIELANYGSSPVSVPVELSQGSGPTKKANVEIAAGGTAQQLSAIEIDGATELTARVDHEDALPADNSAVLLLAPQVPTRVILVGSEKDSPLAAALRSIRGVELQLADATPADDSDSATRTILVFDGATPQTMPPQPALVIGPVAATDLWQYDGKFESPGEVKRQSDKLLGGIELNDVIIDTAAKLRFTASAEVVATFAEGSPMAAIVPRDSGDVVLLTFSPASSDVALRDDFPHLIAAAIRWLGRDNHALQRQWTTASVVDLPSVPGPTRLISPSGDAREAAEGSLVANLLQVGQWQLASESGEVEAALPVSLLSSEESDLRDRSGRIGKPPTSITWWPDIGPLSSILIALALVWVVGQWVCYQRGDID